MILPLCWLYALGHESHWAELGVIYSLCSCGLADYSDITVITDYGEDSSETISVEEFDVVDIAWNDGKGFAKVVCEFRGDPVVLTYYSNNVSWLN